MEGWGTERFSEDNGKGRFAPRRFLNQKREAGKQDDAFFSFCKWALTMCHAPLGAGDVRVYENMVSALEELKV